MSFTNAKVIGHGVEPSAYHRTDIPRGNRDYPVSSSMLGLVAPCPARFLKGFESPGSEAKGTGNLWDTLLLSPGLFATRYVEVPAQYPDKKTGEMKPWNGNATFCRDWKEANKDRELVKSDAMQEAESAVSVVMADPYLSEMIRGAQTQVMVVGEYHDVATGIIVPVKSLLDIVPEANGPSGKFIYDYKTSRNAATHTKRKDVFNYGYARQAAFHSDLYIAATGEDRCAFGHITQENVKPFHVEKDVLSLRFVNIGRRQYQFALALYCHCLATGKWDGYHADEFLDGHRLIQPEDYMELAGDMRTFQIEPEPATAPDDERIDILV